MNKKKEKKPDYPYKFIRVIARRHGYDHLKDIREIHSNVYSSLDYRKNVRIVIDVQQETCLLWEPEEQKLIPQKRIRD